MQGAGHLRRAILSQNRTCRQVSRIFLSDLKYFWAPNNILRLQCRRGGAQAGALHRVPPRLLHLHHLQGKLMEKIFLSNCSQVKQITLTSTLSQCRCMKVKVGSLQLTPITYSIYTHSVPECGFEGLKTYQAPAHIWDLGPAQVMEVIIIDV